MRRTHWMIFTSLCFLLLSAHAIEITNYQATYQIGYDKPGQLQLAIRRYQRNAENYVLLINPQTFTSSAIPLTQFKTEKKLQLIANTPFVKALNRYSAPPYALQNDGIKQADAAVNANFLTVDLCPSKKPFEKDFFRTLANYHASSPTPVAIAVTGLWIEKHAEEFKWLIQQAAQKKLSITWINHSYHHFYDPKSPLDKNFLLAPGTQFEKEVLETEKLLLSYDQLPSPFFRFPGLVSDKNLILKLKKLSLIPIGTDAWLAKNETPTKGSIILVHGNSNEPKGIKMIMPWLKNHQLNLLPLQQAF